MARKVMNLVGLPGSGKTYRLNQIKELCLLPDVTILDDPKHPQSLTQLLESQVDLVVSDPWLCSQHNREKAEELYKKYNYSVCWVFFENNVDKCKRNIQHRNDGRIIENFEIFNYTIPEGEEIIPIWQPD